ncbi:MAG: sigma-54-dependent Fis family transcriptional regulator [Candidatus Eisenbacteria bacterium]|uniref:Sigma-54-dependent Fis family transcriptional regulator n=1 Tax=Eiseniibacteriota bacterium TaxID=2212470 RepID=A0A7Y2EGV0_UNCEI|nr:sigma-54-dependent Fis family transcriptional regulator [Candidatus Eisenbacteria bacterium]
MRATILIVDDESKVRRSVGDYLRDEGYTVLEATETSEAEKIIDANETTVDLILLDVRMPGESGVEFLERLPHIPESIPVVVMSGHGTIEVAIEAVRLGAFDFLEKGFTPERLAITVERGLEVIALRRQNLELRQGLDALHRLVGESKAMKDLRESIQRASPTPAKVLLLGENGVGKELVARAVHELSPRAGGAFVRLNCAAIPKELVESEIFGHEKGAFTGANAQKRGKLELAHAGTLFLDEIGDMNLEAQAKLLRALESSEFERVGGTQTLSFDARIIAATNKDLPAEVESGAFRRDLFYRLNVIPIVVPPLRDRVGDVPLLVNHYLDYFRNEYGRTNLSVAEEAMERLSHYEWPGNVRELRNLVERLVIMTPGSRVGLTQVKSLLGTQASESTDGIGLKLSIPEGEDGLLKRFLDEAERQFLTRELERQSWNVTQVAKVLGIDRANLHRKLKRYGLSRK